MWIIFTLISAFSLAIKDTLYKVLSERGNNKFFIMVILEISIGLTVLIYYSLTSNLNIQRFFQTQAGIIFLVLVPLMVIALTLYYQALSISPLSLTVPFLAFTPVLIPISSYFILGEGVTLITFFGILLVVIGGYTLFFETPRELFKPFRNFFQQKGSVMMTITAIIFSITAVLGRKLVLLVGYANMSAFFSITVAIVFTILIILTGKIKPNNLKISNSLLLIGAILSGVITTCFHFIAIELVNASYMISVKRTSALFSLIFAHWVFRENKLGKRLIGVILILFGVALIAIFQ